MDSSFEELSQALGRLPGFGRRSAERAAMALVADRAKLDALRAALDAAAEGVRLCTLCGSVTSARRNPCSICTDPKRDPAVLCVVEDPGDILLLERAGAFNGRYHALLGRLSAARATGPAELRLRKAIASLQATSLLKLRCQLYIAILSHDDEAKANVETTFTNWKKSKLSDNQRALIDEYEFINNNPAL